MPGMQGHVANRAESGSGPNPPEEASAIIAAAQ